MWSVHIHTSEKSKIDQRLISLKNAVYFRHALKRCLCITMGDRNDARTNETSILSKKEKRRAFSSHASRIYLCRPMHIWKMYEKYFLLKIIGFSHFSHTYEHMGFVIARIWLYTCISCIGKWKCSILGTNIHSHIWTPNIFSRITHTFPYIFTHIWDFWDPDKGS